MSRIPVPLLVGAAAITAAAVLVLTAASRSAGGTSSWATVPFALVALAATASYLVVLAALHVLPTGYSPVRHAVSDYAVGPYGYLFRVGLYVSSVGVLTLAVALSRSVGSPPLGARDLIYLLLIPAARVGMALWPTTLEGERLNRTALVHYACAITAFTLTYLVVTDVTPVLRALGGAAWWGGPLRVTASAVRPELILVVVTMLRPLRRVFGACERLFLLTTNAWFIVVALLLIDRAR